MIAAVGHAIRYILTLPYFGGMHIVAASALASFAIGLLAVLFASRIKCPAEVCFFPALLPMIPGMYAYRTVKLCCYVFIILRKTSSAIISIYWHIMV